MLTQQLLECSVDDFVHKFHRLFRCCAGNGRQCAGKGHKEGMCFERLCVAAWQTTRCAWVTGRRVFHASRGPEGEMQKGMGMRYCG